MAPRESPHGARAAPSVSIVIAAEAAGGWERCLDALAGQSGEALEVLLVGAGIDEARLRASHPFATPVAAPERLLVPQLWAAGIRRARGDVVALTTSHFAPAPGWVRAVRDAHARLGSPAVGGPILPPRGGSMCAWATYFLRYSAYAGYTHEQEVPDLAGDNASYDRAALAAYGAPGEDGFWELDVHRSMRRDGRRLCFVPEMAVQQIGSSGFAPFLRQRLRHGRQFGSGRARTFGPAKRLLAAAALPIIPLLFLRKIAARVLASGRDVGPFLRSMPALLCFLCAWAMGESWGYLSGSDGLRDGS